MDTTRLQALWGAVTYLLFRPQHLLLSVTGHSRYWIDMNEGRKEWASEGFSSFTHTVVTSFRSSCSLQHFSPSPSYLVPFFKTLQLYKSYLHPQPDHCSSFVWNSIFFVTHWSQFFHWVYSLLMPQAHVTEEAVSNESSCSFLSTTKICPGGSPCCPSSHMLQHL